MLIIIIRIIIIIISIIISPRNLNTTTDSFFSEYPLPYVTFRIWQRVIASFPSPFSFSCHFRWLAPLRLRLPRRLQRSYSRSQDTVWRRLCNLRLLDDSFSSQADRGDCASSTFQMLSELAVVPCGSLCLWIQPCTLLLLLSSYFHRILFLSNSSCTLGARFEKNQRVRRELAFGV